MRRRPGPLASGCGLYRSGSDPGGKGIYTAAGSAAATELPTPAHARVPVARGLRLRLVNFERIPRLSLRLFNSGSGHNLAHKAPLPVESA